MAIDLNHSITRRHSFEPLKIEGTIPADLRGTMYRTGPGLLERFGRPVAHPFDADGAITAVRIGDNRADGACRVVESSEFQEEERAGRFLYGTSAAWPRRIRNSLAGKKKRTGNTNMLAWQGRLFALMENAGPVEVDASNLNTRGTTDLGVVRDAFSAHPHRVEALKTTFNFGMRGKHIDLYALPDHGPARCIGSFEPPWMSMIHDFIATDKHLVFVIGPAKLKLWRAMLSIGDLSQYFQWDPAAGTTMVIIPLAATDRPIMFSVDAFWVWHFVNAFEDGDNIVVDLCRHDTFGAFAAPSSAGPQHAEPRLHRYTLNPAARSMRTERLLDLPAEFPSVHPLTTGARQRFTWFQMFPSDEQLPGVARLDARTGHLETWGTNRQHLGCEPMFVPRDTREEAGWILQLFQDPTLQQSYLAILDAEHIADGPVAKIWLNEPVPMTFHGTFVNANAR